MSKEIVVPGEELCVIEEFIGLENTYSEGGFVYTKVVGNPQYDIEKKEVKVKPSKLPAIPLEKEIVYAQVLRVKDVAANLLVFYSESRRKPLLPPFEGTLHAMNIVSGRIKDIFSAIGYGDIIRASVLSGKTTPLVLSLRGRDLGVIYSRCPFCLSPLVKKGTSLFCRQCKKEIKKKISLKYYIVKR